MQRHQGDPVCRRVLAVRITGERGGGQKSLEVTLIIFFLVLETRIHQLLEVAATLFGLIGAISD